MTTKTCSLMLCGLAVSVFTFCGCGGSESSPSVSEESKVENGGAHSHDTPHGGLLAVLGSHEYHAEVLHDEDTNQVTAIISDSEWQPIESKITNVKLNLMVADVPEPFSLSPQTRKAGEEVRFSTVNAELCELVCEGWEGNAEVSADIDGAPYRGKLAKPEGDHEDHDEDEGHDEDGHEEDGHDEDGHDEDGHDEDGDDH
ncbi:MAG: hypothetical protein HQ581_03200 [Planctomycetes bacterium]|nr:hypothetical protein [Planctomycetota bacterium]